MLIEKFREDDLTCPYCHCPQENVFKITNDEGEYKCEICKKDFNYEYHVNGEWSSFLKEK